MIRAKIDASITAVTGLLVTRGISILDIAQGVNVSLQIIAGLITVYILFKKAKKSNQ